MFEKIEEIEIKYENLQKHLELPETYMDPDKLKKINQELSEIEEIVKTYREYKKVLKEIKENEELMQDEELKQLAKEEKARLELEEKQLKEKLQILLLPVDPLDKKNIILEIRAGTGGEEAALFAADLFRSYSKFADMMHWKLEIMNESVSDIRGFKEIIALISGDRVYSYLKYESGVHRVQRVPMTESQGRIHTSTVTVAILPEADEVDVKIDEDDVKIDVFRASGHGGQHINVTDSAVRITHIPTGIVISCQDERSQHKNKAKAMKILRARLLDLAIQEKEKEECEERRKQVGRGKRSEKIRTYNYPQNRVTDHRIGLTIYNLDAIMEGNILQIIEPLQSYYKAEALKMM